MAYYKFHNDCQSAVLTYQQVRRLDYVMDQCVPIYGRGSFPTLFVKLKELIRLVSTKLAKHSIKICDIRLNGGAASYVLAPDNSHYNDLDLIFGTDLSDESQFDVIRDVVLECLRELFVGQQQRNANALARQRNCSQLKHQQPDQREATNSDDSRRHLAPAADVTAAAAAAAAAAATSNHDDDQANHQAHPDAATPSHKQAESSNSSQQQQLPQTSSIRQHAPNTHQMPLSNCAIKEAYVHKMVKVNDDDRWSLISLGVHQSEANCCSRLSALTNPCLTNCNQFQFAPNSSASFATSDFNNTISSATNGTTYDDNQQDDNTTSTRPDSEMANSQDYHNNQLLCFNHHNHQQQFPNSIELKFVDRMRRKFEFSVDSFQIMLDSLIKFYDFAPQAIIITQSLLSSRQSSAKKLATITNASQSIDSKSDNQSCCCPKDARSSINTSTSSSQISINTKACECARKEHNQPESSKSLVNSRNYYIQHQYSIVSANSQQSIPSEASSSGCSSSSSVVSSSSSSLSCDDDDNEYLDYCSSTSTGMATPGPLLLSSEESSSSATITSAANHERPDVSAQQMSAYPVADHGLRTCNGSNGCSKSSPPSSMALDKNLNEHNDCLERKSVDNFNATRSESATSQGTSCAVISENFYPTVIGRSEYGNFKEALYHLERKLIATRSPEEIRGGGLLKYCNLLVKNYKPTNTYTIRTLERYMCSRFFIDFSDLNQQQAKLESYLANHFSDDPVLKFEYLTILHNVVERSTVCLMNHELRLTLNMIRDLAYKLNEDQHRQQETQQSQLQLMQQQQPPAMQRYQKYINQSREQRPQQTSTHEQQTYFEPQKPPVTFQSGLYRVKLVNYALVKPVGH